MRNPLFEPEDIEKEKGVILEELKMEVDNPEYLIHEIFSSHFWKGHALGRSILGTKQTIRSFDRDMIERYYKQFYSPVEHPDHGGRQLEPQEAGASWPRIIWAI